MKVVVYGTPNCINCDQLKKYLDYRKIIYVYIDITKEEEPVHIVKSVPTMYVDDKMFSGTMESIDYLRKFIL